jgi:hypothetical protein
MSTLRTKLKEQEEETRSIHPEFITEKKPVNMKKTVCVQMWKHRIRIDLEPYFSLMLP